MKEFNTTGTCFPKKHYMVDIGERLEVIKSLIDDGKYFCINRGRQYGKTTTLDALADYLGNDYTVFSISFEGDGDSMFASPAAVFAGFFQKLAFEVEFCEGLNLSDQLREFFKASNFDAVHAMELVQFRKSVATLCKKSDKPIVILIDEVDQAGNYDSFIKFLGALREMYLKREKLPTFRSVILAGVYDIKNLKLKIRDENEHQYNSPWNIAAPFDYDMSLSEKGIAGMLADYENDHHTGMDVAAIAKLLREYTSGYPFLVSRLCQLMDEQKLKIENGELRIEDGETVAGWNREGFLKAVKSLLGEGNTLFDDFQKKLCQFPSLANLLRQVLYNGRGITFNRYDFDMGLAASFGFVKSEIGPLKVSNRIFEIWLYDYFVTAQEKGEILFEKAKESKSQFVLPDGTLDMPRILERFVVAFSEIYGDRDARFLEDEGRRYFMLYIKPIINGVGNYYIEPETRDGLRADMVIDYLGRRYVIEMKIWRGNSYNERGEKQLTEYLDRFQVETGYMVSFSFNKTKAPGLQPPIKIGERTIIEALV